MSDLSYVSTFSGIGGFDLGFDRAGMECALQVEKDDHCLTLLGNRWPSVRKATDIQEIKGNEKEIRSADLICGGFPCQDVSVAGRRKGLAGSRSGLWFDFHRIVAKSKPGWVVIENVPGLLSSNGGKDFAVILRGLVECGYGVAWRILDAQYFGLAQRRRRVFIVGSLGSGRAAEVLFERESGHWDSPPRREARQDVTEVAGTLAANAGGTNRPAGNANELDFCVAFSAGNSGDSYGIGYGENVTPPFRAGNSGTNQVPTIAFQQNTRDEVWLMGGDGQIAGALAAEPGMKQQNYVARSLTSRNERIDFETENFIVAGTFNGYSGGPDDNDSQANHVVGFSADRDGGDATRELMPTLKHGGDDPRHHNAFKKPAISGSSGVRRLTPTECERLQGFPDGWTSGFTDSVRYRMLGNAVAVPCAEWIAMRIANV